MSIFSTQTILFILAAVGTFHILPVNRRPFLLLAASLLFYALIQPGYLPLLLAGCLAVWWIARRLSGPDESFRKSWLWTGILVAVAPLLLFKYADLMIRTAADVLDCKAPLLHLLAPLGISFYTFRMISYLVDVYARRGSAESNPLFVILYISWFPQILSGPIERAGAMMDRLKNPAVPEMDRAIRRIMAGLFKKMVIAERLALFVDPVFRDPSAYAGIHLVFAAFFFYLQIYCDFAGYTDLAVGISELLGIRSSENFDHPLSSRSVSEFWRRWHITLSFWLRDYIFLPLSYALLRRARNWSPGTAEISVYITATTATMFIAGLWHGAGWNFVVWGLLHALFMSVSHITRRRRKRLRRALGLHRRRTIRRRLQWIFTFTLLSFTWVFFRSSTIGGALDYLGSMSLKMSGIGWAHLGATLGFALAFVLAETGSRRGWWSKLTPSSPFVRALLVAMASCILILLSVDGSNEFIYFRF